MSIALVRTGAVATVTLDQPDKLNALSQVYRRIGLAPDGGAIWFLYRRIVMARGKDLVFPGRTVGPEDALALGFVEEVVPDEGLGAAAAARAAEGIAAFETKRPPRFLGR